MRAIAADGVSLSACLCVGHVTVRPAPTTSERDAVWWTKDFGCTLAPSGECDGSICAVAEAMRPVATVTVASCILCILPYSSRILLVEYDRISRLCYTVRVQTFPVFSGSN